MNRNGWRNHLLNYSLARQRHDDYKRRIEEHEERYPFAIRYRYQGVSILGLLGIVALAVILVIVGIAFDWFASIFQFFGLAVTGSEIVRFLVASAVCFCSLWMLELIVRFLLPPRWRFPAMPLWLLFALSALLVAAALLLGVTPQDLGFTARG